MAVVVVARGIAPQVPVGVWPAPRLARRLEPSMLVARVVEDEIEDDPHPAAVRLLDESIEVGITAEHRVDGRVVADVVADVESG